LRANQISEFAFGTLPAWPFISYVLLTIGGLAFLSIGLLAGHFSIWLGWLTLTADLLFLLIYLRFWGLSGPSIPAPLGLLSGR
jgi:hypothetical protein